jgi:hypothetical protein
VQEMTVRLGAVTKRGHAEAIFHSFGAFWGWFSLVAEAEKKKGRKPSSKELTLATAMALRSYASWSNQEVEYLDRIFFVTPNTAIIVNPFCCSRCCETLFI